MITVATRQLFKLRSLINVAMYYYNTFSREHGVGDGDLRPFEKRIFNDLLISSLGRFIVYTLYGSITRDYQSYNHGIKVIAKDDAQIENV